MLLSYILVVGALLNIPVLAVPSARSNCAKRTSTTTTNANTNKPVLQKNFPDPSILQADDGKWYSFATSGNGHKVQVARADALEGPWKLLDKEPLPQAGNWTSNKNTWAPDVQRVGNGQYVMYYSGQLANKTKHCVGAATSDTILGPYTPSESWFECDVSVGGAIDPSGFLDADGLRYVVYKIDGNSIGHGGSCGNTKKPQMATPIMLQRVSAADGVTKIGAAVEILDRSAEDGPLVEAPALLRTTGGRYALFYSSGCYSSSSYDIRYATASSVRGPYTRAAAPLLGSADARLNLTAPGGATPVQNGSAIVFHADCDEGRCLFEHSLTIKGKNITLF